MGKDDSELCSGWKACKRLVAEVVVDYKRGVRSISCTIKGSGSQREQTWTTPGAPIGLEQEHKDKSL